MIARSRTIVAQGALKGILMSAAALCLTTLVGCASQRPVDTVRASGDHRLRSGDYAGARDEFAEIVARYPGDWEAQYKLGLSMLRTGELSAARRSLEIAYTAKPQNPEVAAALAECMFQQNDESRLFAFLRERATASNKVEDYLQLARYAAEMGDPDTARTAIDTALQLDNGRTTGPYIEAAKLEQRLGNFDEAVRRLRQAYGINTADFRVHQQLITLGESMDSVTPLPPGR